MGKYGNIDVAFLGDFCQLAICKSQEKTIYASYGLAEWHDYINCFIELKGMYCYAQDPEYGQMLLHFRNNCQTQEDFDKINS